MNFLNHPDGSKKLSGKQLLGIINGVVLAVMKRLNDPVTASFCLDFKFHREFACSDRNARAGNINAPAIPGEVNYKGISLKTCLFKKKGYLKIAGQA